MTQHKTQTVANKDRCDTVEYIYRAEGGGNGQKRRHYGSQTAAGSNMTKCKECQPKYLDITLIFWKQKISHHIQTLRINYTRSVPDLSRCAGSPLIQKHIQERLKTGMGSRGL